MPSNTVKSVNPRGKIWAACVTSTGKARRVCKSSAGKHKKQWLLGKLKLRQNDYIKIDVKQIGRNSMNRIKLTWFESPNFGLL